MRTLLRFLRILSWGIKLGVGDWGFEVWISAGLPLSCRGEDTKDSPPTSKSVRRRGCPRRPPTPPYERFRIRRFLICVCIINQQCLTSYKHPALPHDFRSLLPAFRPSCEASAQNVQKSGLALHIRFSSSLWWLGQLLWRLLTSVGPSMYLTMPLAQGRPTDLPG